MIDENNRTKKSDDFEHQVGGIFDKYNLIVEKLDRNKKSRFPDYFAQTKDKKGGFVCECKYIHSAGVIDNGNYHVSTEDMNLPHRNGKPFRFDGFCKIEEVIIDANKQFLSLVQNKPKFAKFPFVIALEFDFFADLFDFIPKNLYGIETISAILRIERNFELKSFLEKMTITDLEKFINKDISVKLPPNTKKFKVLLAKNPEIKFQASKYLKNPIIA